MNQINLSDHTPSHLNGERLDRALASIWPEYSRAQFKQWIQSGNVTVDGKTITLPRQKIYADQFLTIQTTLGTQTTWIAENISINIVQEEDSFIVINKPAGLVVHPGAGNPNGTLVNALLHHSPTLTTVPRCGMIHRLDKDTTGLLVIAKTLAAHHHLSKAMLAREIKRRYQAIVQGVVISGGTINERIGRHSLSRTKMAVSPTGRSAITHYRVAERFHAHSLLNIELETGRTHQIRVHFTDQGYPLIGDRTYQKKKALEHKITPALQAALKAFPRQALHAKELAFLHPETQQPLHFNIPLPADMESLLVALRQDIKDST